MLSCLQRTTDLLFERSRSTGIQRLEQLLFGIASYALEYSLSVICSFGIVAIRGGRHHGLERWAAAHHAEERIAKQVRGVTHTLARELFDGQIVSWNK